MQESFSEDSRKILRKGLYLSVLLLLNILIFKKFLMALGLFLGVGGSYFNFWHISRTYSKIVDEKMDQKKIASYAFSKYIFRLAVSLIILIVAMKLGKEVFAGAIVGLLIIKAAIFIENGLELMQNYFHNYLAKLKRR